MFYVSACLIYVDYFLFVYHEVASRGTLQNVMHDLSAAGIENPHAQRMAFDLSHCVPDNNILDHDDPVTSLRAALENMTRVTISCLLLSLFPFPSQRFIYFYIL